MMRHRIESVFHRATVIVRAGNAHNPRTYWRVPADAVSWQSILELAREQGWRSPDLDGDPSRVGSTEGPAGAVGAS